MEKSTLDLLALSLVPGLGSATINRLLNELGSAGEILRAGRRQLQAYSLAPEAQSFILSGLAIREAEETVQKAERQSTHILTRYDPHYPYLLSQTYDPPWVLYVKGSVDVLYRPSVAVVGSRRCSVYGREITRRLCHELATLGLNIVSGMARGIDSAAHRGALEKNGGTVAVLGNGVDVVYPRENRKLYRQIQERGCVISEFPLGSFPAPQNFPIRNRIISGLCYGTLLTEAAEFSGSLITARLTLEQNRELWAVPGNITSSKSYGPNYLIKQGAKPILGVQDVLDELPYYVLERLKAPDKDAAKTSSRIRGSEVRLPRNEAAVADLLRCDTPKHFDLLLKESGLEISELNSILLALEMKGLAQTLPGRQYSRRL